MDYRKKIYSKYVSCNISYLHGAFSIKDIEKQFPVWKKYFSKFLPANKENVIVELGCGNGGLIYWLKKLGYKNVLGVDISIEQIEYAKKLGIADVVQNNLIDFIRDKNEYYDLIFLRDVLEHFNKEEIIDIMSLVYNSLKKGGKIIIQTPNGAGIFGSRYRYHDFTHEISFTENSLRQILLMNNFSDLKFYETAPVIHGIKSFIRFILWKFIRIFLQIFLLIETGGTEKILTQNIIVIGRKK